MLLATGISPEFISLIISVVLLVSSVIAAVIVLSKTKGNEQTLAFLSDGNEALRKVNVDLQSQLDAQEVKFMKLLHDQDKAHLKALSEQDRECAAQIGELRGKVEVLTGAFGKELASSVLKVIREEKL